MPLMENMRKEQVGRLSLRDPVAVQKNTTIRQTVEKMRERKLGCAIIVDATHKPLGMFTEAMLSQLLVQNPAVVDEPIRYHMASQCPGVRLTDPIADVLDALELKNVRFLCVLDAEDRLVGLTGQKGLMEYIAEHFPQEIIVQRIGGKPHPQAREGA